MPLNWKHWEQIKRNCQFFINFSAEVLDTLYNAFLNVRRVYSVHVDDIRNVLFAHVAIKLIHDIFARSSFSFRQQYITEYESARTKISEEEETAVHLVERWDRQSPFLQRCTPTHDTSYGHASLSLRLSRIMKILINDMWHERRFFFVFSKYFIS